MLSTPQTHCLCDVAIPQLSQREYEVKKREESAEAAEQLAERYSLKEQSLWAAEQGLKERENALHRGELAVVQVSLLRWDFLVLVGFCSLIARVLNPCTAAQRHCSHLLLVAHSFSQSDDLGFLLLMT